MDFLWLYTCSCILQGQCLDSPSPLFLPLRHGGAQLSGANGSKMLYMEGKLQSVFLPADPSAAVAVKLCVLLVFLWLAEQKADHVGTKKWVKSFPMLYSYCLVPNGGGWGPARSGLLLALNQQLAGGWFQQEWNWALRDHCSKNIPSVKARCLLQQNAWAWEENVLSSFLDGRRGEGSGGWALPGVVTSVAGAQHLCPEGSARALHCMKKLEFGVWAERAGKRFHHWREQEQQRCVDGWSGQRMGSRDFWDMVPASASLGQMV